jgi:hypothetical protein
MLTKERHPGDVPSEAVTQVEALSKHAVSKSVFPNAFSVFSDLCLTCRSILDMGIFEDANLRFNLK